MNMIEDYSFGRIRISGKVYNSDLIITNDKIVENWWRKKGHEICLEDLRKYNVLNKDYDVIIIGTGYYGMVKVLDEVKDYFKGKDVFIADTKRAVEKFNEVIKTGKKVLGMFHLTC